MFTVIKVTGRTPLCENCKKRRAEKQVVGDSDLSKLYLCRACFYDLIACVKEFLGEVPHGSR